MPNPPSETRSFLSLMQIAADLRGIDGCPWDKEQTHQSLAPCLIEEAYELAEALDPFKELDGTRLASPSQEALLQEELGDVLFQVALHSQIAQERKSFDIYDVIQSISEKLIRRHPHVYSNQPAKNIDEVWTQWDKIKETEKEAKEAKQGIEEKSSPKKSKIFNIPPQLPALQRAYKIGVKTQRRKFDWSRPEQVLEKMKEELSELEEALETKNQTSIQEELGDVLFTLAQLARHLNVEPEQSLRQANHKFETRFEAMLHLTESRGLDWDQLTEVEKEALWGEVKKALRENS